MKKYSFEFEATMVAVCNVTVDANSIKEAFKKFREFELNDDWKEGDQISCEIDFSTATIDGEWIKDAKDEEEYFYQYQENISEVEEENMDYKRREPNNFDRIEYLEKLENTLQRHWNSWFALSNMFNGAFEYEFEINDFITEKYPFAKSHDELFAEVEEWIHNTSRLVQNARKSLEPNLAHRNDWKDKYYKVEEPQAEYHGVIDGRRFITCSVHYENITIRDDEGKIYYLPPETLLIALNEFLFMAEKKRTRTWLKPLVSDKVEEDNTAYGYLERESEARMKEILRLRALIRNFPFDAYYVVIVRGDVEPELSVKSKTADERDSLAKQIKANDSDQDDGIYWLNIVDGVPEIGSYSGFFFEDEDEVGEPKAPYYKLSTVRDKWVCAFDTWCCGWECVRHHGGELDGLPYLYDSKEAVKSDSLFDKDNDFAYRAEMFKEGRKLVFNADGSLTILGEYIAREPEGEYSPSLVLGIGHRSEYAEFLDVAKIKVDIDNYTRLNILKAMWQCRKEKHIFSINIDSNGMCDFLKNDDTESDDFRADVVYYTVYSNSACVYAQSKYDCNCNFESEMFYINDKMIIETDSQKELNQMI
jgi:hypothetical protein